MTARIAAGPEALPDIPRAQRAPEPRPLDAYLAAAAGDRGRAMAAAYAGGGHTLRAIGRYFGVHESTVSRAVRRGEARGMLDCKT